MENINNLKYPFGTTFTEQAKLIKEAKESSKPKHQITNGSSSQPIELHQQVGKIYDDLTLHGESIDTIKKAIAELTIPNSTITYSTEIIENLTTMLTLLGITVPKRTNNSSNGDIIKGLIDAVKNHLSETLHQQVSEIFNDLTLHDKPLDDIKQTIAALTIPNSTITYSTEIIENL
ncbi:MAG: hypothetical protein ACO3K7_04270, partial [Candidatus Marinamargulisbacteria bacterium]